MTPVETQPSTGGRGAEAAARVAARYAKAPKYSDMLAGEARAAVRAAEAASRAAQEAQAAAESVLAELEAASIEEPEPATHRQSIFEVHAEEVRGLSEQGHGSVEGISILEAEQPIHANLIEFPAEHVVERKVRSRRTERQNADADEHERQLSIFEVDPGSIMIQSTAVTNPEWLGIELEEEPVRQEVVAKAASVTALYPASISLRMMATVVDGALIAAAVLAFAMVVAANAQVLPKIKEIEVGAAVAFAVISLLYQALFFSLAKSTPGMKYAHISLCTFDDQIPTGAQRLVRLGALLLSLLPVGLGVAWALFDEEHLSWHDRISRTYQRKG